MAGATGYVLKDHNKLAAFWLQSSTIAACDAGTGGVETATGITFPGLVDGLVYVGSGVRVKYGFVKVRSSSYHHLIVINCQMTETAVG